MVIIETFKGCLMFLGIIAMLIFIILGLEVAVLLAKEAIAEPDESLHKNSEHDKIKQKPDRGYREEKDRGE